MKNNKKKEETMRTISIEYCIVTDAKSVVLDELLEKMDVAVKRYLSTKTSAAGFSTLIRCGKKSVCSNPVLFKKSKEKKVEPKYCVKMKCTCKKGIINCRCGFHHNKPEWKKANKKK